MKIAVSILTALFTGCATAIPYSYEENCALRGMKLIGVEEINANSSAFSANGSAFGSTYGESVRCAVPQSVEEKQEIANTRRYLGPVVEYNDSVGGKRLLTGVGYFIYIVPGIAFKIGFDNQRQTAIKKAMELKQVQHADNPETKSHAQGGS